MCCCPGCRHWPGCRRARAWERGQREVRTQAAGPGLLIRRARLLLPAILGPKPLLVVPLLKHMKEENNQLPKALEYKDRQS